MHNSKQRSDFAQPRFVYTGRTFSVKGIASETLSILSLLPLFIMASARFLCPRHNSLKVASPVAASFLPLHHHIVCLNAEL